ncbi:MAG: hypothetical protein P8182_01890 [Deltaproteobacteria bacterium]
MYIKLEQDEHILVRTVKGPDNLPREIVLARLGQDPELNLFLCAETGRREDPERWDGVEDFHLLQALENFKRRQGGMKPALVSVNIHRPREENNEADAE